MHVFGAANVDYLQRADEELDHAIGHLTDTLTSTGGDQRDRLADRARICGTPSKRPGRGGRSGPSTTRSRPSNSSY
ncbi:hypothetical protein AB0N17_46600, partial [Streptomyces sp. NPDC051133]|uniref:hypothetical protein n=1 Tax=Streptomyces sp. NPDC051133 TaxID=3155521 RepID=UPI00344A4C28